MEEFPVGPVEAVCLGTSLALSGLCYYVYRRKRRPLDRLNEAPHLPLDEKLTDLLNAAPGKCLRYVVIEGAAQPVGEPLRSVFQEGSVGVLQKLMLKEHKLVWNSFARAWMDSERVVHQRVNAVPFSLVGCGQPGQGSGQVTGVRVLSPLEASGLHMEVVHEKFHQATYGFSDMVGMYLSGEKPKGQLETEEMVKVGATLTGVGELILDTDRALKLRPPGDGSPYLLSTADFETLRQDHEREAGAWRALACAFALAALAALLWAGRRYYRGVTRRRERLTREFLASEEDPGGEAEASVQNACAVCLVRPRACVMLDCGHVCCCAACARALTAAMATPLCPICRQSIRRVVPLYQA